MGVAKTSEGIARKAMKLQKRTKSRIKMKSNTYMGDVSKIVNGSDADYLLDECEVNGYLIKSSSSSLLSR